MFQHVSKPLRKLRSGHQFFSFVLSHVRLCHLMDCSPPNFSVHGILQARILEWVAMPSSRRSSQPRDRTHISYSSCISRQFFTTELPERAGVGKQMFLLRPLGAGSLLDWLFMSSLEGGTFWECQEWGLRIPSVIGIFARLLRRS